MAEAGIRVGAEVAAADGFALLTGRRVGLVTNGAARIGSDPVIDVMLAAGVDVVTVFAPEHGFEADVAAGALVADGTDPERGLRVVSLYGTERSPTAETLADVDVLVFDLQDVGVRAYTYLATMALSMAAAAEVGVPVVVFDRPNPLGDPEREGWVRADGFESFVSLLPVPAVHGMTAGEMALAVAGEGWVPGAADVELTVVPVEGWTRSVAWPETGLSWAPPSPSLPTTESVAIYPGTVLLEATTLSLGRGTALPFTSIGAPWVDGGALAEAMNGRNLPGVAFEPLMISPVASDAVPDPPFAGETVPGVRVVIVDAGAVRPLAVGVHLLDEVIIQAGASGIGDVIDRPEMLDLLAGTDRLRLGLAAGRSADELVAEWAAEVAAFDQTRAPYLLYD